MNDAIDYDHPRFTHEGNACSVGCGNFNELTDLRMQRERLLERIQRLDPPPSEIHRNAYKTHIVPDFGTQPAYTSSAPVSRWQWIGLIAAWLVVSALVILSILVGIPAYIRWAVAA